MWPIEAPFWREEEYRAAFARMAREDADAIVVSEMNENWHTAASALGRSDHARCPSRHRGH
jgi:hypothetical protein